VTFIEEFRKVRTSMEESNREVGIISVIIQLFIFLYIYIISFATFPLFNFILAQARKEAKNEARSEISIYDQLLKCTWAIYVVHVVHVVNSFFYRLVIRLVIYIPQAY